MRTTARMACILICVTLSGCAGHIVHQTRDVMIGKSWEDILACVGIPDKTETTDSGLTVVQWQYTQSQTVGTISLAAIAAIAAPIIAVPATMASGSTFSLSGSGDCKAIGTVRNGTLTGLKFSGENSTVLTGKEGLCAPIVRGCVE